jgi:outer membrane receptor for ferric coprogen and ferric-rhodotorulic acid
VQQLNVVSPTGVMVGNPTPYAVEKTPTFRYGIVFKPIEVVSIYAGHTESYISGAGANRKADGSQLDPQSGENDEVGVKIDIPGQWDGVLSGSISYFQTKVTNIWRSDPSNPGFFVQDGVQENEGIEAQLTYGGPKLSWVVGYYDGNGPVTTSAANKPLSPFAPQRTFNFWGKYNLTERLAVGGGYRYQSETRSSRQDGMTTDPFSTRRGIFHRLPRLLRPKLSANTPPTFCAFCAFLRPSPPLIPFVIGHLSFDIPRRRRGVRLPRQLREHADKT